MRKIEAAYLVAVGTMALVIFTLSLHRCNELRGLWQDSTTSASIGKPRTVNVEEIRLLMKQGKLSDKEAKFYTSSPALEEQLPVLPSKK
ncbi:MAG: hypothetical protein KJ630_10065 [Proteobacteria bacterium]|nr:hypothetical protein [Pseudomonadota bacterium]